MKVKVMLKQVCPTKLMFVKILKNYTCLGLKDSKDICDRLHEQPFRYVEIELDPPVDVSAPDHANEFKKELLDMGLEFYMNGGTEFERNRKLLALGLGDKEDYVSFLEEAIVNQKELLNLALRKLSKEDLKEIFDNVKTI